MLFVLRVCIIDRVHCVLGERSNDANKALGVLELILTGMQVLRGMHNAFLAGVTMTCVGVQLGLGVVGGHIVGIGRGILE